MDIVYIVRRGDLNDELRWSLRSVAENVAHDRVWIVGHKPEWARGCFHIHTSQFSTKYANSTANVRAACESGEVSDPFLLLNDDMFIMAPQPEVFPTLHRGPLSDVIAYYEARYPSSPYLAGMRQTRDLLADAGHDQIMSWELHVPLVVHKQPMLEALAMGQGIDVFHKRTAYGTIAGLTGKQIADVKVNDANPLLDPLSPHLSTDDVSFAAKPVGDFIRSKFPDRGPYEREAVSHGLSVG